MELCCALQGLSQTNSNLSAMMENNCWLVVVKGYRLQVTGYIQVTGRLQVGRLVKGWLLACWL